MSFLDAFNSIVRNVILNHLAKRERAWRVRQMHSFAPFELNVFRAAFSAIDESVSRTIAKSFWSRGDVAEFVDDVEGLDVEGRRVSVGDRFVIHEVLPDGQLRAVGWRGAVLPYYVRRVIDL